MRVEQEGSSQERQLRFVADHAAVFLAYCDCGRRYRYVNRGYAQRFGLEPEEIIGRTIPEVVGRRAYATFEHYVDRVLAGEAVEFEVAIPYEKIGQRVMFCRYVPELDDLGGVQGLVAVVVDVTEKKDAEEALRRGEERFRSLSACSPVGIFLTDTEGHCTYTNPRLRAICGCTEEQALGDGWSHFVHPDDRTRIFREWGASARAGGEYSGEFRFQHPDGTVRWTHVRSSPMVGDAGRLIGHVGTVEDITERKDAEGALRQNEGRFRLLADAGAALAALVDHETALRTVAQLAVPGFADLSTVVLVEPDGEFRRLVIAHRDPAKVALVEEITRRYPYRIEDPVPSARVVRTGKSELAPQIPESVLVAAAKDEEHLRLLQSLGITSFMCVPLKGPGGTPVGAITYATAESGRQYGPDDLAIAEELASRAGIAIENARLYSELRDADRQKDEFLAVLAHELRNPLAPIRTALQLSRVGGHDATLRDRAHAVMERQLQQLVRLVDDLLDVSRITRGRIELRRERCALATILQSAVDTSRPLIESAGHHLTVAFPAQPIELDADGTRLAQVFSNLLNNAAKYTPRGGRIRLEADIKDGAAVVRVCDSGIGIPADMLSRVFDMFTQVDRSLEKAHGGLGIGLTLVKRLVEMHGGTVEARSDGPGQGTEFVVRLPVAAGARPPSAEDETRSAERQRASTRYRILIADDNRDAADSLAMLLEMRGHEIRTVYDGVDAVRAAAEWRPDAVLLDIGMPRLNGFDAARRIREACDGNLALVAVTGWGQEQDRRRAKEAGFDGHLVKPVDAGMVERTIAEARSTSKN